MPKFKVVWEERRYVIIEANSKKEAEEIVSDGNFPPTTVKSGEVTCMPEAFEM